MGDTSENDAGADKVVFTAESSIIAATATGAHSTAHGVIHVHQGLSYHDVRDIADERAAIAMERLRESVGLAHTRSISDMLDVSLAIIRSLVAEKLGAESTSEAVANFLGKAVEDPQFAARAARLFQEGAKTPSIVRRQMLARALFGIPASTPARDRVDAAIERLFPEDVSLLRQLSRLDAQRNNDEIVLVNLMQNGPIYATYLALAEESFAISASIPCLEFPLYALQTAGCILFGPWIAAFGPRKAYPGTGMSILPLGHAVLDALENAGMTEHHERQE